MSTQKQNMSHDHAPDSVKGLASKLLPIVARKKAANNLPVNAGGSFFYELGKGWETDILRKDNDVCTVTNVFELEDAFTDQRIKTILIPHNASITKTIALRVCRRHGQGKTVFYEG